MGILDEAIKEHLELKRRRGADPTEIDREEREALGPVRRMAEEGSAAAPAAPEPPEAPHDDEHEIFDDEHESEPEEFEHGDVEEEEDTAAHTVVAHPEPAAPSDSAAEPAGADTRYDGSVSPAYEDEEGPETAEYDVEAEHHASHDDEHDGEEDDDDMLEETPEFLQDAPEHDRLWFEQRPPKDFDFDG